MASRRKTTKSERNLPVMTTGEAAVATLIAHGIDTVYALPGVHNDPLFDAFHAARDRLRVIHTRHEQGAAYMALGAALATGRPQAFSVVPGPGLLNASAALLTAWGMNAPVLALVGQIPQADIDRGHGHLHEIHDQTGLARHFTAFAERIRAPHEAPDVLSRALQTAQSGRPRPVMVEAAIDVWGRRGTVVPASGPLPRIRPPIDLQSVENAAKILGAAERPLIVLGGGAQDAAAEITALAEMLEAPAMGYRRGRGVVASTHRLAINLPIAHRLWKDADVVLGIGTRLQYGQMQWGSDGGLKIVRIDIDAEEIERFRRPAAAILGDAREAVGALISALPRHNRKRASRAAELAAHHAWFAGKMAKLEPQAGFVAAIRDALPADGILVDEVTQIGFAARLAFPVLQPRTFLSPGYQDNLGWGYGTALGVKAALPGRAVVAIAGDGGFLYQVGELATAAKHKIGLVAVVFDNSSFGNVRLLQETHYGGRLIASDLASPDFVKLAESFGVAGYRARTARDLKRALDRALAAGEPALIHVPCARMPSPWDMILMPRVRG
jgi:acetolactate synthase-1/2/3 large subunit